MLYHKCASNGPAYTQMECVGISKSVTKRCKNSIATLPRLAGLIDFAHLAWRHLDCFVERRVGNDRQKQRVHGSC